MSQKLSRVGVWILLAALAITNVLLIRQNLQMRREIEKYEPRTLNVGERLPSFTAKGLDGAPVEVSYAANSRKKVLLYFTPTCPFCREQFAYWREMLERIDTNCFEVIGLVNELEDKTKLQNYLHFVNCSSESPTPLRVALIPDTVRDRYMLTSTPITLVLAADGTVEQNWAGRWTDDEIPVASSSLGFTISPL